MVCTQCRQTVWRNDIGICMHCQHKYERFNQPDSWDNQMKCMRCGRDKPVKDCRICNGE